MKNCKKFLIYSFVLFALLFIVNSSVTAHYLWLETELETTQREALTINSFWGHLDDDTTNLTTTDVTKFIQNPDGIIKELSYEQKDNYLTASTDLNSVGSYQIYAIRPADVYQRSLNQFTAKSYTQVEKTTEAKNWNKVVGLPLEIILHTNPFTLEPNTEVEIEIRYLGQALADNEVSLVSSNNPEQETTATTDQKGKTTIKLEDNDNYLLTTDYELATNGTHNNRDYDNINHTHAVFLQTD